MNHSSTLEVGVADNAFVGGPGSLQHRRGHLPEPRDRLELPPESQGFFEPLLDLPLRVGFENLIEQLVPSIAVEEYPEQQI